MPARLVPVTFWILFIGRISFNQHVVGMLPWQCDVTSFQMCPSNWERFNLSDTLLESLMDNYYDIRHSFCVNMKLVIS